MRKTKELTGAVGPKDGVQIAVITNSGRVVTQDILKQYQVTPPESKQIDDNEWKPEVLEPPYDLSKLMGWLNISVVHNSCVQVKKQDTVGIGYYLEPVDENKEGDSENGQNYKTLETFFGLVNPNEDIKAMLKKVFIDYEACGNGYIEVTRGVDNKVNGLYHINATTMRWLKDKKRLVQKVGTKFVYFKLFGDEKILNKDTGNFVKSVDPDKAANEVIPIKQYSWMSAVYGTPEWLPALFAMFGDMQESQYNIDFFTNYGVPAYAIVVEGTTITPEVNEEITKYFETQLKGSNHKTLTLSTPKGATLKFERLSVETKEASFRMYHKDNRDSILTAHHVPPYRVGIVEQGQLGGNVAEETDRIYLDSVINPRQEEFAWVINEFIIKQGLEIEDWVFVFDDINISDVKRQSELHQTYFNIGAMTPNEIRRELGLDPYEGGDIFYVQMGLIPVGVSEEGKENSRSVLPEGTLINDEEKKKGIKEYSEGR